MRTASGVWHPGFRSGAEERSREECDGIAKKQGMSWQFEAKSTLWWVHGDSFFYDVTTSAADATTDADHDGRQEETRGEERDSETAVSEPHGAGGDAERDDGMELERRW